jgi:hypothetical protein
MFIDGSVSSLPTARFPSPGRSSQHDGGKQITPAVFQDMEDGWGEADHNVNLIPRNDRRNQLRNDLLKVEAVVDSGATCAPAGTIPVNVSIEYDCMWSRRRQLMLPRNRHDILIVRIA